MAILRRLLSRRTLAAASGGTVLFLGGGYWYLNSGPAYPVPTMVTRRPPPPWTPPSRADLLAKLKASGKIKNPTNNEEEFDLLIIGGGASGAGCAVDAATRGLKVALVERDDFSAGACRCRAEKVASLSPVRHVVQVNQACAWRCALPAESRVRTRLRPVQTCPRGAP